MISTIPRQELSNLLSMYKDLPFPNNDRLGIRVSLNVPFAVYLDISNDNNDDIVSFTSSYEFDNEGIETILQSNTSVKALEVAVRQKLEALQAELARISAAYRTSKPVLWNYLKTHQGSPWWIDPLGCKYYILFIFCIDEVYLIYATKSRSRVASPWAFNHGIFYTFIYMKTRRVIITLELTTDEHFKDLKSKDWWQEMVSNYTCNLNTEIVQVQANVSEPKKKKKWW
mgnify:FL=1